MKTKKNVLSSSFIAQARQWAMGKVPFLNTANVQLLQRKESHRLLDAPSRQVCIGLMSGQLEAWGGVAPHPHAAQPVSLSVRSHSNERSLCHSAGVPSQTHTSVTFTHDVHKPTSARSLAATQRLASKTTTPIRRQRAMGGSRNGVCPMMSPTTNQFQSTVQTGEAG